MLGVAAGQGAAAVVFGVCWPFRVSKIDSIHWR